jgi:hypothetical protein
MNENEIEKCIENFICAIEESYYDYIEKPQFRQELLLKIGVDTSTFLDQIKGKYEDMKNEII